MNLNVERNIAHAFARHPRDPGFLAQKVERYYSERVRDTWSGGHIMRGQVPQSDALCLTSNDYLSIAKHPQILAATASELHRTGSGVVKSAVFLNGFACPLQELEDSLAQYMRSESGVVCQSGWCANTGLIKTIANEQTPIYIDILAHASLWEGVYSARAKPVSILHNDPEHLAKQIARHGPGVVIVDSVYSTNGSVCPLKEFVAVGEAGGGVLGVDESHSIGTHGPEGAGMVVALGLADRVHFRTASLAKSFASRAGFITCTKRFTEYFKSESNPAIFSSTLLPYEIAGLAATLDVIRREDWRRDTLHSNARYLREHLAALGYNLNDSQSQIVSLEAGTEQLTILLRDCLEARGIFGSIFCAPATPKNRALMRFSVNTELTEDDLKRLVQVCSEIRDEVGLADWSSSRRSQRSATIRCD